jgi:UDP-N-acetylmuramoyl-tripeptide--D-alanyl-D-alanine ligase
MRVSEIIDATGGTLVSGDRESSARGLETDTRAMRPGGLFVALRGENFDANDFLGEAVAAGAAVIVCARGRAGAVARTGGTAAFIEVDDTLHALGDVAARHRRSFDITVAAVTGSNGKTTTKEILRAIMTEVHGADAVLANEGNLNNLVGLPLTLAKITAGHRVAVVEMGMNAPGEIARLTEIAAPDVGVITCVGSAHLEGLGSIEGIAAAKGELFAGLAPSAVAVVNVDDPHVLRQAERFTGRTVSFGSGADVAAENVEPLSVDATRFELSVAGVRHTVELSLGGRHNVSNALAAAACAYALGVESGAIAAALGRVVPPPMRLAHELLPNGVEVINDCYNANPSSLAAAMAMVAETVPGRRIVVLGDMLELGAAADDLHVQAGLGAALLDPVLVCALGERAERVAAGAREGGLDREVIVAATHEQAADEVARVWRAGDTVLVKGSRGATMERVVEEMRRRATP